MRGSRRFLRMRMRCFAVRNVETLTTPGMHTLGAVKSALLLAWRLVRRRVALYTTAIVYTAKHVAPSPLTALTTRSVADCHQSYCYCRRADCDRL